MGAWKTRNVTMIGALILAVGFVIACAQAPQATAPEEFYRGKTITWVVSAGAAPGGEADTLARAIGPYLAKETGATVKIDNMDSDEGVNFVYTQAKRDGLTLVIKSRDAVIANDILKAPGVLYETEKFNFVADVRPSGKLLQVSPKFPQKTLEALRQAKGLRVGGTTAKGSLATSGAVGIELLGLDGKVITGFNGAGELRLSLARGEVDLIVNSDGSAGKYEADGILVNVLAMTSERIPILPNVPTMFELGVKVPKELEGVHKYVASAGFAAALPPEVPQERVEFLRKVFQKISGEQDFMKSLQTTLGDARPFTPGKELQDLMVSIKSNTALVSQLDAIFAKHKATQ